MARNISVKIPTSLLIAQIEESIAEIDKAVADYPRLRDEYEVANEKYKTKVAEFVSAYLGKNLSKIGYNHDDTIRLSRTYNNRLEVSFDSDSIEGFPEKPEEPSRPNQSEWFGREHATRKSLLEKNLKILKMTTQEEVSASTYGAIMEIL